MSFLFWFVRPLTFSPVRPSFPLVQRVSHSRSIPASPLQLLSLILEALHHTQIACLDTFSRNREATTVGREQSLGSSDGCSLVVREPIHKEAFKNFQLTNNIP